jgi:hypothetical protein
VLWGELSRYIQTAKYPLDQTKGGPLIVNQLGLRKVVNKEIDAMSYCIGMVAADDRMAAMQGHHIAQTGDGIPRTLAVIDEASSVKDEYKKMFDTWANRLLIIGNTWDCNNFFKWAIKGSPDGTDKGGDIPDSRAPLSPDGVPTRYHRKIIQIKADHSPNVILGKEYDRLGIPYTGQLVIPGVLPYEEYLFRRERLDAHRQCVSLDAEFYEGAELKMFPPLWLNRANQIATSLLGKARHAKAIGIDPAEGGDKTAMAAVDEFGLIELISKKTPNTAVITGEAIAFMRRHNVIAENVVFDRGGGGKEHADRLRMQGFNVRTEAFGSAPMLEPKRGMTRIEEKKEIREDHYAYVNRRAEMYGALRELIDPTANPKGFGLPAIYPELRRQLSPIPLTYDGEGRLFLLPKNKKDPTSTTKTLTELIGCSPDEADAVVLAIFGMQNKAKKVTAGAT